MLLGRSSRLGDMRNEVLDSRRSTPPSGRGVAIAGGGPGRTVKEHCLYTVIGNVSVTTRSWQGTPGIGGQEKLSERMVRTSSSSRTQGWKVGECYHSGWLEVPVNMEGNPASTQSLAESLSYTQWMVTSPGSEKRLWGVVSNQCGQLAHGLQVGLAGSSSPFPRR